MLRGTFLAPAMALFCLPIFNSGFADAPRPKPDLNELKRTCQYRQYALEEEFARPKAPGRDALLQKVALIPEFVRVADLFEVPLHKRKDWLFRAVTVMDMGACEFIWGDILEYGEKSYFDFATALFESFYPEKRTVQYQKNYPEGYPFGYHSEYTNFEILSVANFGLNDPRSQGRIRPQECMWDGAITEDEKNILENSELKDITEVQYMTRVNSRNETVSGYFMHYSKLKDIYDDGDKPGIISRWESDIKNLEGLDNLEYQSEVATLYRRCIAHHIFTDGNGRACRIWAFNTLAQRKIPYPFLWSNEDVLVEQKEYLTRWNKGIEAHQKYLKSIKQPVVN